MTPQQHSILDAIRSLTVDGVSPSYDDICLHVGLASKSTVFRAVRTLEREGWLVRSSDCARTLLPTTPQPLDRMSRKALLALRSEIDQRLAA